MDTPGKPAYRRISWTQAFQTEWLRTLIWLGIGLVLLALIPKTGSAAPSSRDRDADGKRHWAFKPPVHPPLPALANASWPKSAIDHFILARMESKGLVPVRDAAKQPLLRRLYFDLIGLPPKPSAIDNFVNDASPNALEKVVDRLLASPRFGERWGRHWLDVARYAESSGKEFNFTYPHAWPYRRYVIEAFNQDKPYDRFIREQLAGDLLPSRSREERDEQRLATGFLAIGEKRHNANQKTFRMDMVDDQITTTSKAFLGLTVGCARCHDHKFDPIPTEDYYSLAGIFLSTKTLYGTSKKKYSDHPSGLVPYGPDAEKLHKAYQAYKKRLKKTETKLEEAEKKLKDLKSKQKESSESKTKDGEGGSPTDKKVAAAKAKVKRLKGKVAEIKEGKPAAPRYAMGAKEADKAVQAHVAIGGNPSKQGKQVPRGFLSAIDVKDAPEIDPKASGRLALANWIANRDNPLTARVIVNRVWHHLFGRGLVESVDNFGALGKRPSHPKLLDYLAVRFMENDWSIKELIRSIVLSRTYRLSTHYDRQNGRIDPENSLYWRMSPRRLEVEPLRDAILSASGALNLRRPSGSPVTKLGQKLARKFPYKKMNPANHHRTVYLPVVRHYLPHMLQEFDFPSSSLVIGDRAETTVPAQALFLLNSDFILEQSKKMAKRLFKSEAKGKTRRIVLAYRLTLSRSPSIEEVTEAASYLSQSQKGLRSRYPEKERRRLLAWAGLCQALFASAEFRYLIEPPRQSHPPREALSRLNQEIDHGKPPR